MTKEEKIKNIEDSLFSLKDGIDQGYANIPNYENENYDYQDQKQNLNHGSYMAAGNYNYLASRILFKMSVYEYSFFCAQQCIENYLKGFLKVKGENIKDTHDIFYLLQKCRKFNSKNDFINSEAIEVIVRKFIIFNELPRYPVVKKFKSKTGGYIICETNDINILDYFILKMRTIMVFPEERADLLKFEGVYSMLGEETRKIFKEGNVNFY